MSQQGHDSQQGLDARHAHRLSGDHPATASWIGTEDVGERFRQHLLMREIHDADKLINEFWHGELDRGAISPLTLTGYEIDRLLSMDVWRAIKFLRQSTEVDLLNVPVADALPALQGGPGAVGCKIHTDTTLNDSKIGRECAQFLACSLWAPHSEELHRRYRQIADQRLRQCVDLLLTAMCFFGYQRQGKRHQMYRTAKLLLPLRDLHRLLYEFGRDTGARGTRGIAPATKDGECGELFRALVSMMKLSDRNFHRIGDEICMLNHIFVSMTESNIVPSARIFRNLLMANFGHYRTSADTGGATGVTTAGLYTSEALNWLRDEVAREDPRIHYDLLCAAIKAGDVSGSVRIAQSMGTAKAIEFMFTQWVNHGKALAVCGQLVQETLAAERTGARNAPTLLTPVAYHRLITALIREHKNSTQPLSPEGISIIHTAARLHQQMVPHVSSPPPQATIHSLMTALAHSSDARSLDFLIELFHDMDERPAWRSHLRPDQYTFAILADGLARAGKIGDVAMLTEVMVRRGIRVTTHYYAVLMRALMVPVQPQYIESVYFGDSPRVGLDRDSIRTTITLRRCHALSDTSKSAMTSNDRNLGWPHPRPLPSADGIRPSPAAIEAAEALFEDMQSIGIERNEYIYSTMIYGFARLGMADKAQLYFDHLLTECRREPDESTPQSSLSSQPCVRVNEVLWGVLMYAYVRARDLKGVFRVWRQAREWRATNTELHPDPAAATNAFTAVRSNHLLNMVTMCLLDSGRPRDALRFLAEHLGLGGRDSDGSSGAPSVGASTGSSGGDDRHRRGSQLFYSLLSRHPDSLSMVLRAYIQTRHFQKVLCIYDRVVRERGCGSDSSGGGAPAQGDPPQVLTQLARACIEVGDPHRAASVISTMISLHQTPRPQLLIHLIHGFERIGESRGVVHAFRWLEQLEGHTYGYPSQAPSSAILHNHQLWHDPTALVAVVRALAKHGHSKDALEIARHALDHWYTDPPDPVHAELSRFVYGNAFMCQAS
ncbi:hypothetical protein EV182_002145 [Spiromyces aspiralis]|uniref:Uncharacterized protein n=1 Tax=Spiromyces aspiralis TaxID=68401 RepID=A0ACC1HVX8_9FUNG|nr:hypothetical protein EV182_002145 [Spiromyces aspiralis]